MVAPAGGGDRYAALNDAAREQAGDWLLFAVPPASGDQQVAAERLATDGGALDATTLADGSLLVRRAAFESVGGFHEGVIAGAELDLFLRLGELGFAVGALPAEDDPAALRWLGRRYPQRRRRPGLRGLWRYLAADNRTAARRRLPPRAAEPALVLITDAYPARSETFIYREVEALAALGWNVRVESSARPQRSERAAERATRVDYLEDDPPLRSLLDLLRLLVRHPLRCLADRRDRGRWSIEEDPWPLRALASAARRLERGGERHIHAHFAAGAALHGMRLARLRGIPYSVIGHGYDVFRDPRNLAEKLEAAAFVVGPCAYTAEQLRRELPQERRDRVHVVVMGIDGEQFTRAAPAPGGRTVVAIGRLVEKKGFRYLVEAAQILAAEGRPLGRLAIAGDGPLRGELERAIAAAGLAGSAEIVDAWGTAAIRELLEGADLLAMPAVIAADGDRDAMPVVVKEALAMEIPVVASDEVGLPELVEPEWGRLVAARDSRALAAAIDELLALAPAERARMGAAGRAHVLAHCDVYAETAKLAALIAAASPPGD